VSDDAVRRWTRILSGLRARGAKLRRPDAAGAPLEVLAAELLETCDSLLQDLAGAHMLCDQLRRDLHAELSNRLHLIEQMPIGCVTTDETSIIQNANQPAAELFNVSAKHLRGRLLLHFSEDRRAFGQLLENLPLAAEGRLDASVSVRPRERGPFTLNAVIVPANTTDRRSWLWFLTTAAAGRVATHAAGSAYAADRRLPEDGKLDIA